MTTETLPSVLPAYRKRDDRNQAIVTLTDRKTKVRRDYYLGLYNSAESRQMYYRLLAEWESILDALERDPLACADRVDWAAKYHLLSAFREAEKLDWSDPWLQSLDMEYHNIDPEAGLYHEMLRTGAARRFVEEEDICQAMSHPPTTTRAFHRGRAVTEHSETIESIQWDEVVFRTPHGLRTMPLEPKSGKN